MSELRIKKGIAKLTQERETMEPQDLQLLYNQFIENQPIWNQERLCGPSPSQASGNEWYFITKYAVNNLLDVGCGTGNRTFPDYIQRGISFIGVEKFPNLVEGSPYWERIITADLTSSDFEQRVFNNPLFLQLPDKLDITALFGGIVNAFLEPESRAMGWANIAKLLTRSSYVVFDTLTHFDWFETNAEGKNVNLLDQNIIPSQYFYSRSELNQLFRTHTMELVEERTERINMGFKRTHYLLRSA